MGSRRDPSKQDDSGVPILPGQLERLRPGSYLVLRLELRRLPAEAQGIPRKIPGTPRTSEIPGRMDQLLAQRLQTTNRTPGQERSESLRASFSEGGGDVTALFRAHRPNRLA